MAAAASPVQFNAGEESKKLLAKSYAEVAEAPPPTNGANGKLEANGANGVKGSNREGAVDGDTSNGTKHMAAVLRIVNTDTAPSETKEKEEERPKVERQESQHEYSATVR